MVQGMTEPYQGTSKGPTTHTDVVSNIAVISLNALWDQHRGKTSRVIVDNSI